MSMELGSSSVYLNTPRQSCWSKLTKREKNLVLAITITSTLALAFIITTIVLANDYRKRGVQDINPKAVVCRTETCIQAAYLIGTNMDETRKPCEDFHSFACGNFARMHKNITSNVFVANGQMYNQVKEILENSPIRKEKLGATDEALRLYRSCMDLENKESEGISSTIGLLNEILESGLPMAVGDGWTASKFDWTLTVARYIKGFHQDFLLPFQIYPSTTKPLQYTPTMMKLSQAEDQITTRITGTDHMKETICLLYPDTCNHEKTSKDIADLIAYLSPSYKGRSVGTSEESKEAEDDTVLEADDRITFREYELAELQNDIPSVNWTRFIRTILDVDKINQSFTITTNKPILNNSIVYWNNMEKRLLANYIGWTFITTWGRVFSDQIRKILTPKVTRDKLCYALVNQVMGFAVGKLYADKYIPVQTFSEVYSITESLQKAFESLLEEAQWLDDSTRRTALKKLRNMKSSVGLPSWALDDRTLNEHYREIKDVNKVSFEKAFRMVKKNFFNRHLEMLQRAVNVQDDWSASSPIQTNAVHFRPTNSMFYFLGILGNPLYFSGCPSALRYGTFGYIAGHEVTHGFDSSGRYWDENGLPNEWWSHEADQAFVERAKCFVDLYSNITDEMTHLKLNGSICLKENIADSGGLRAAFQAFKNSPAEAKGLLQGLEHYTEEQLFFIAAAQAWCSDETEESLKVSITSGTHSPAKYRATVPFQNDPEFARAFSCQEATFMNPQNKCKLW